MDFPHLNDTQFPLLNNVNVYEYKNEFDYTRWTENTKVKLTNVLWNSDYRDVVKFASDAARDAWFDNREDYFEFTLTSSHSLPPEGGIKLPIPYDVAVRCNYMVVEIPVMTSAQQPIEYESVEDGVRRWYFFIDDVSSRAPNTTMFNISLDVWTQFHNDIEINYMFLERGHAPVAATSTADYLSNPIGNSDYLLTPDVTPTAANVVRNATYIPFGNGEKWLCMATTITASMLSTIGHSIANADYTYGNYSYADAQGRDGYQLTVNNFGVGNGHDWSSLRLDAASSASGGAHKRLQNNLTVFAVPTTDVQGWGAGTFFYDVTRDCPNFMNAIRGVFIVDRAMLDLDTTNTAAIAGHTMYIVNGGTDRTDSIPTLTVSDFGFPQRYQRFAKLYTFPYSVIQLTDNEGETVDVRIENTGSIDVHRITQLAFPFLNTRVFFSGINGVGSHSYTWKLLDGTSTNAEILDGDWFDCCFDHEIPCYALYMDGETAWYLDNFNSAVRGGRNNKLAAYHNSVRVANTTKENVEDTDATMVTNADADATTLTTNMANNVSTARANADLTIANNAAKVSYANSIATFITTNNNNKADAVTAAHNLLMSQTSQTQNHVTSMTTAFSNGAAGAGAAGNIVIGGLLYGGATAAAAGAAVGTAAAPGPGTLAGAAAGLMLGGLSGLVSAAASADAASNSAMSVMNANSADALNATLCNTRELNATMGYATSNTNLMNDENTYNVTHDNDLLDDTTDNTGSNNNTNAANTAATMRANAGRSQATGDANAGYTRDSLVASAKENLDNARNDIQYEMYDAANAPARQIANYAGNPTADYMRTRGVQMKIRTMPDAEVRQVGDWFARYGYALEQVWDVSESGLCPMEHFCYWKCRDIWIDNRRNSNNEAVLLLTTMFQRGVTVWNDPDIVGKVSVYDN